MGRSVRRRRQGTGAGVGGLAGTCAVDFLLSTTEPPDSAPDSSTTPSAPGGPSATGAGCRTAQVQRARVCDCVTSGLEHGLELSSDCLRTCPNAQVTTVANELQLDRSEVLAWLKRNARSTRDEVRRGTQHSEWRLQLAALFVSRGLCLPTFPVCVQAPPPPPPQSPPGRDATRGATSVSPSPLQQLRSRRATAATAAAPPAPRLSKEDFHSRLPPGVAYWKTFRKTRLGRDQRDTLERVYAQTRFPSDAIIASMYDLVRLQRDDVISWFKEKRTADAIAAEEARGGRSRAPRGPRSESAERGARQQEAPRQHAGEEEGEEHTLRASLVRGNGEAPRARRTYSRPAADSPWPRSRPDAADWQPRGRTRDGEPSHRRDDRR